MVVLSQYEIGMSTSINKNTFKNIMYLLLYFIGVL